MQLSQPRWFYNWCIPHNSCNSVKICCSAIDAAHTTHANLYKYNNKCKLATLQHYRSWPKSLDILVKISSWLLLKYLATIRCRHQSCPHQHAPCSYNVTTSKNVYICVLADVLIIGHCEEVHMKRSVTTMIISIKCCADVQNLLCIFSIITFTKNSSKNTQV